MARLFLRGVGVAIGAVVLLVQSAAACLWDSDTLRTELKGLPGIAEIVTGRFERQPPLYYEMRLERASAVIASDADNLDAYDDAGVACERLGRGDEAIDWMRQKREALDRLGNDSPRVGDHLYRYYANLGTFLAHRWLRRGGDRSDMADMTAAKDAIAKAIKIKPDAHFGRERYQLMAIDWMTNPPPPVDSEGRYASIFEVSPLVTPKVRSRIRPPINGKHLAELGLDDAVEGLTGLIALGSAWESVDVFYALAIALDDRGDASAAYLARLRCQELLDEGARSLYPGGMSVAALEYIGHSVYEDQKSEIRGFFQESRAEADAWRRDRDAFMLKQLRAGRHPDTDADFWSGYHETSPPKPPNGTFGLIGANRTIAVGSVVLVGIVAVLSVGLMFSLRRLLAWRRRRRGAGAEAT